VQAFADGYEGGRIECPFPMDAGRPEKKDKKGVNGILSDGRERAKREHLGVTSGRWALGVKKGVGKLVSQYVTVSYIQRRTKRAALKEV